MGMRGPKPHRHCMAVSEGCKRRMTWSECPWLLGASASRCPSTFSRNLRTSLSSVLGLVHLIPMVILWGKHWYYPTLQMKMLSWSRGRDYPGYYSKQDAMSRCRCQTQQCSSKSLCPNRGDARGFGHQGSMADL